MRPPDREPRHHSKQRHRQRPSRRPPTSLLRARPCPEIRKAGTQAFSDCRGVVREQFRGAMRFLVPAASVMPRLHSKVTLAADASPTQSVPATTAESETVGRDHSPTQRSLPVATQLRYAKFSLVLRSHSKLPP